MIAQYKKMLICKETDGVRKFENQFLLSCEDETYKDFYVDFSGDLFFNTDIKVVEIENEILVKNLDDVYNICKENNIYIPAECITEDGLICGGERDYLINHNLEGDWIDK